MAVIGIAGLAFQPALAQEGKSPGAWNLKSPDARAAVVKQLRTEAEASRALAWKRAAAEGWSPKGDGYELQAIRGNRVYVYHTRNVAAAISTAASLVRNTLLYSVNGTGRTAGVWDQGSVRSTHQEFGGRITVKDGAAAADHSTHVGGTIGAAGVDARALGMAPGVHIDSYDWNSDASEMASRAMAFSGETNTIQLSNHSYGYLRGWHGTTWYGTWPAREDEGFGQYDATAQELDSICYSAPYYLPCKAAGNDRSDNAPSSGTLVYYAGANFYKTYIPATDPYSDGYDNGGFDTIGGDGTAKNILTVGAVNDAVSVGVRSVAAATMSSFSCWGPADDGRIKPDVVGNGVNLCSSLGSGDTSYGWMSGTSMATPNVCGSAVLLTDYYGVLFPGQYMRASTLKGLIIHTADDLGNAGPDYKYGWGLMNTKAAADLIKSHHDVPSGLHLMELSVDAVATCRTNTFAWDGTSPIRATLCWTDPAGPVRSGLDNTNRVLVNDLDLLIVGPAGQVYFPYVLALTNPAAAATTGTNRVDNVEQVYIASPGSAGAYRVVVSLHGELSGPSQEYSVLLSGSAASPTSPPVIVADSPLPSGRVGAAYLQNLTAIGGTTPYVWSTPAGTLPSGLSLGSGGGLSGTPNATTSANFRVRVTGGNGVYAEVAFRLGIDSLLFSEGFENGGVMPAGWTQAYVTDTVDWVFQSGGYNYKDILHPASAHGGSYNAFLSVDAYNDHKTRLVTPMINLGANAQNAQLTFWHNMEIWGTDQDELRVFYQTSSGGSWMLLATYTNSVASWTQRTLALSGATNTCAIAFEGNVKWGYGVSLDDVAITTTPPPTQTSWGTPYAWLNQHGLATGGDYEAAAAADQDGDGYAAWQEYVAGTEPTNYSSVFLAGIAMSNALPQVIWMPDLGMARVYTVEGLTNLLGSGWGATNSDSRFFRVNVALP